MDGEEAVAVGALGGLALHLVRHHHRVLVETVVGLEQIELEVPGQLAGDALSEDHDSLGSLP